MQVFLFSFFFIQRDTVPFVIFRHGFGKFKPTYCARGLADDTSHPLDWHSTVRATLLEATQARGWLFLTPTIFHSATKPQSLRLSAPPSASWILLLFKTRILVEILTSLNIRSELLSEPSAKCNIKLMTMLDYFFNIDELPSISRFFNLICSLISN